ncbi:MAG: UvrD-helicase domain-containing protein [Clostridia bacterium]|nr:UvrD-helicase domain-containing protein [Clostridia bacterium]
MSDINTRFITLRREVIKKTFSRMNDMQFKGVVTAKGPVLILAGAGSGKTTVLVNRIASLVKFGDAFNSDYVPPFVNEETFPQIQAAAESGDFENGGIFSVDAARPWEILAITFTNKAAGELKERIAGILGDDAVDVCAGTFHSVCGRILRRFGDRLGYTSHFTIYDTDDSKRVMKDVYKNIGLDEKMIPIKSTLNAISNAKDMLITPEQFIAENTGDIRLAKIGKAYLYYQKALKDADAMDFDDMIVNTVRLFKESKEALDFYHRRFRYIMVDEYQDTNHAQYELVSLLAQKSRNICVVGDDDQSIYRFRGATIENILSFEDTYSDSTVIRLEQNYRSTSIILDAANAVIANNKARKGKNLWTSADGGEKIEVYTAPGEKEEASHVVDQILNSVAAGGKYSDNAVLYRMNAQSNAIENVLARSGVPYRVVGGHRFYDRKEIRDVIAYLNVIANHGDRVRLTRIINEPKRGIGDSTVAKAIEISDQTGLTLFEVFNTADKFPPLQRMAKKLKDFCAMIERLTEMVGQVSLVELFEEMLDKTGYTLALIAEGREGADRLDNVKELASSIAQYEQEHDDPSLSGFLEEVALISDIDQFDAEADAVVLMTIHSAKGLEFNNVYLVGLEEGIFPGNQSIYGTEEDIEEERRLAYVAITRARKKLHISNAYTRMLYGQTGRNEPSRFLEEIPKELCNIKSVRSGMSAFGMGSAEFRYSDGRSGYNGYGSGSSYSYGNSYGSSRSTDESSGFDEFFPPKKPQHTEGTLWQRSKAKPQTSASKGCYSVGQRVRHKVFGEGMILSSKPMGNDTLLEIAFDEKGTKKLMANFARLEKL